MGLDVDYGAWEGSYSAFRRWRARLAIVAGYVAYDPDIARGNPHFPVKIGTVGWAKLDADSRKMAGDWDEMPDDPLLILLAHYDCGGEIKAEHCGPLADRLEQLLPYLHGNGGGHIGTYRAKTQTFIDGLREAVADGEGVEFE